MNDNEIKKSGKSSLESLGKVAVVALLAKLLSKATCKCKEAITRKKAMDAAIRMNNQTISESEDEGDL